MAGEIDEKNLSLIDDENESDAEIDTDDDFTLDVDENDDENPADEDNGGDEEDIDEVELDEDDELDESDNADDESNDDTDGNDGDKDNADGQDNENAATEELKKQLDAEKMANARLKAQARETLEKLGIKVGDNVEESLEQAAAESDGISVEEYRKSKREADEVAQVKETVRRQKFEQLAATDLAELKKSFPDLLEKNQIKEVFDNFDDFVKFGRLRDNGIDVKTAYMAVKGETVRAKQAQAATQKAANDGKSHIMSVAPKKASGESVTMPKDILREWRDIFPNKSDKEIMALYKKTL